jgi:inner membrane transporter RhtA
MSSMRSRTIPPQAYFAGSAVFHYLGPAFAVLLFARVAPLGVAWLRIVSAAIIFAAWRRPWRPLRAAPRSAALLVAALGVVLAVMNCCFYEAIARLPLGTVSAIEFLPVILLAALGMRSARNAGALALAVAGVYILMEVRLRGGALGFLLAFANAGLFALYIVLAHRVSRQPGLRGIDGLGAAMVVAAVAITPIGGPAVAPHLVDLTAIGAGVGVGVSSSVIPYVCDQLAMARLRRATYSLMVSLLPATATVVGLLVLGQVPTPRQMLGVALVVAAVALHREKAEGASDSALHRERAEGASDSALHRERAEGASDSATAAAARRPRRGVPAGLAGLRRSGRLLSR